MSTAMRGSEQGPQIQVQKVGVPTQATIDADMLAQINDITRWVPAEMRKTFFGYMNNILGMGKLTPKQGLAMILGFENIVDYYLMSIPPWEAEDPKLIVKIENALNFVKILVRKATTTNEAMNERSWIAAGPNPMGTPMQAAPTPRKKLFGLF